MSDSVVVQTQVKNQKALEAACRAMGDELSCQSLGIGSHKLYDGSFQGLGVKFKSWQFPIVFDLKTGAATYDTYRGAWGDEADLTRLISRYEAEVMKQEGEANGYIFVEEKVHNDGRVEVFLGIPDGVGGDGGLGGGGLGAASIG